MDAGFSIIAGTFKTNAKMFAKSLEGIPLERWYTRPGDDSNHMMWLTGHVVVHRAKVLTLLGQEWSAPWASLFLRGSQLASPGEYPAADEILRAWDEISERLAAALESVPGEALAQPVAKGWPTLDGKVGGTIAFMSLHETYHVGQMSYLRKWLGYGQTVG